MIVLLALWPALISCAQAANHLEGSVGDQYSLDFDQVIAERVMDEFIIRYVKRVAAQGEAVRIIIPQSVLVRGTDIQMAEDIRVEHYYVRHDASNQLVQEPDFPQLDSGAIRLNDVAEELGDLVQGSFSCLFVNGRTLNGYFDTQLFAPGS